MKKRHPSMFNPKTRAKLDAERAAVVAQLAARGNLRIYTPEEVRVFAADRGEDAAADAVLATSYRRSYE